ncbi:hypothetical protein, partial [Anaerotignum faecicola]
KAAYGGRVYLPCALLFSSSEILALHSSSPLGWFVSKLPRRLRIPFGKLLTAQEGAAGEACFA